jgi:hypothetical protein
MKPAADMHEEPEAFTRFENLMKSVLSVPREVIQREVQEHRQP